MTQIKIEAHKRPVGSKGEPLDFTVHADDSVFCWFHHEGTTSTCVWPGAIDFPQLEEALFNGLSRHLFLEPPKIADARVELVGGDLSEEFLSLSSNANRESFEKRLQNASSLKMIRIDVPREPNRGEFSFTAERMTVEHVSGARNLELAVRFDGTGIVSGWLGNLLSWAATHHQSKFFEDTGYDAASKLTPQIGEIVTKY